MPKSQQITATGGFGLRPTTGTVHGSRATTVGPLNISNAVPPDRAQQRLGHRAPAAVVPGVHHDRGGGRTAEVLQHGVVILFVPVPNERKKRKDKKTKRQKNKQTNKQTNKTYKTKQERE